MTLPALSAEEIFGPDLDHDARVQWYLSQERAKRDARRLLAAEDQGSTELPPLETLRARLARPRTVTPWRIEGWLPQGGRALLVAQFKSGKSTLVGNTVRSLLDGDPFLGRDAVTPVAGAVALIDFEMSPAQLDTWLAEQRIRHDDRLLVVPMRGRAAAFNILDASIRREWARHLRTRGAAFPILDCARPVMDALGLDEHRDAGRLLVAFDMLLAEAGINEGLVVHHMGHTGERARGDSRFRDWPDVEWRLVRQDDDPASPRFIAAFGRDVDMPESQLTFEREGRRLLIADGSRADARTDAVLADIAELLGRTGEPMNGKAIKAALDEHPRDLVDAALKRARGTGELAWSTGTRGAKLYSLAGSDVPVGSGTFLQERPSVRGLYKARTVGSSDGGVKDAERL